MLETIWYGIHKYTIFRFLCSTSLQYTISYALRGKLGQLFYPAKTKENTLLLWNPSSYAYYQVKLDYTVTSAVGSVSGIIYKQYYGSRCLYSNINDFYVEKIAQAKEDLFKDFTPKICGEPHTLTIHSASGAHYNPDYNPTFFEALEVFQRKYLFLLYRRQFNCI